MSSLAQPVEFAPQPGVQPRGRRSKGCGTCRKRRVKCDEGRPVCDRCRKGSLKCQGYEVPRIFINLDAESQSAVQAKSVKSKGPTNVSSLSPAATPRQSAITSMSRWRKPVSRIAPSFPLDAFKNEIVISHLISKLSLHIDENPPYDDAASMSAVLATQDRDSTAYVSGLSVAEALFGRIHHMSDMTAHSTELYGCALRQLRKELQQSSQSVDRAFTNLWSCVFLGVYEMVSSSSPTNWLEHSRGVSALTQMAGPYSFQPRPARRMFDINRSFISIGAIAQRKRSFLEDEAWKTIPWSQEPHTKSIGSMLQDVLCDMPGMMEDADSISSALHKGEDVYDLQEDLQHKITQASHEADILRWQWEEAYPNVCWEMEPDPDTSVSKTKGGTPLFDRVLFFQRQDLAIVAIYFNVLRLLIYSISDTAGIYLPSPAPSSTTAPMGPFSNPLLLPGQGTREQHALDICRAVDGMVFGTRDTHGAFILVFPLRVAYGHLENREDVRQWLREFFAHISTSKGFQIGEYVLGYNPETIKTATG